MLILSESSFKLICSFDQNIVLVHAERKELQFLNAQDS